MSDDVAENDTVTASDAVTGVVDDRSEPERQRDEYLDALQRLQADFENYRKRVARSSMDAADRAAGEVVVKMLPVLDAFDLAAQHFSSAPSEEAEAWIRRGDYYSTHSRRRDWSESTPWVSSSTASTRRGRPREGDDGPLVDQVLRAGYRWKGSVLTSRNGESSRLTRWSNVSGSTRTTTRS